MPKKLTQFRLNDETLTYIDDYAKKINLTKTATLEKIISDHRSLEPDASNIKLASDITTGVLEGLSKILTRIRLGVNNADRNSDVIIELLNSLFIFDNIPFISTDISQADAVVGAMDLIKERIARLRQINITKGDEKT